MKTYLLDTFNRYKRWSEQLDVNTILCNKAWNIFNDSGQKEVYIFQSDGSLIISLDGKVSNGKWKYITANQSIVIEGCEQGYMLHPAFMDEIILALQVDGTNEYAFMIDEKNKQSFAPTSLLTLQQYFEQKIEQEKRIEEERKNALIAQQKKEAEQRRIEAEKKRETEINELRNDITAPLECVFLIIAFVGLVSAFITFIVSLENESIAGVFLGGLLFLGTIIYAIYLRRILDYFCKSQIEQWKIEHPDDWRAKYL